MIYKNMKYAILSALFASVALTSCIDDFEACIEDYGIPEEIQDGYSLNLTVTIDKMGGTRAGEAGNMSDNPLEEIENYIDPEKFRVLFFDNNDKFLFESRSRWVKKLNITGSSHTEWLVSVPVFTYGNDKYDYTDENGNKIYNAEWNWDLIRTAIKKNSFKVAILANRPELDYYPKLSDVALNEHWYDNRGPYWNPGDTGKKDVFDLHHCQYDPMYLGKGTANGYYDFVMGDWDDTDDNNDWTNMKPTMGATSSWVYWGEPGHEAPGKDPTVYDEEFKSTAAARYARRPKEDYPIPMYGIQRFDAIGDRWIKGTPFNLSNLLTEANSDDENTSDDTQSGNTYTYKSISLLRSVVRLDLIIPKSLCPNPPEIVGLFYSNIYARCEPMNVWDPTDEIWEDNHDNCEWKAIMNYGLISSDAYTVDINVPNGPKRNRDDGTGGEQKAAKSDYQKILSWFYGSWQKKNWFTTGGGKNVTPVAENPDIPYPQIFNPCIQRNKLVICNEKGEGDVNDLYHDDDNWHYVVYTGERNMIDPTTLPRIGNNPYAASWMFKVDTDQYYCIPIADYTYLDSKRKYRNSLAVSGFGPYTAFNFLGDDENGTFNPPIGTGVKTADRAMNMKWYGQNLMHDVQVGDTDEMPWPLLRNHVYVITVGPKSNQNTRAGDKGISVQTKEFHSESIRFD